MGCHTCFEVCENDIDDDKDGEYCEDDDNGDDDDEKKNNVI